MLCIVWNGISGWRQFIAVNSLKSVYPDRVNCWHTACNDKNNWSAEKVFMYVCATVVPAGKMYATIRRNYIGKRKYDQIPSTMTQKLCLILQPISLIVFNNPHVHQITLACQIMMFFWTLIAKEK